MTNENNSVTEKVKIIVKVGKKSKLRFSHSKVYRAVSADELSRLHNIYSDCSMVIIENILEEEQDAIRKFISEFTSQSKNNKVFFYMADDITSGIADEFDLDLFENLSSLYSAIDKALGSNVSTLVDDRQRRLQEMFGEMDTDPIVPGEPDGTDNKIEDEFGDLEDLTPSIFDTPADTSSDEDTENLPLEEYPDGIKATPEFNFDGDTVTPVGESIKLDKQPEIKSEQAEVKSAPAPDVTKESATKKETFTKLSASDSKELDELRKELNDLRYDNSELKKSKQRVENEVDNLKNAVMILKDEKEEMLKQSRELFKKTEVIEQPISLSEYEGLRTTIDDLNAKITSLNHTIERDKKALEGKDADLQEKDLDIAGKVQTITELAEEVQNLKNNLQVLAEYKDKVDSYEQQVADRTFEIESLHTELDNKQQEIQNVINAGKQEVQNTLDANKKELADKQKEVDDKQSKIESYIIEVNELQSKIESLTAELQQSNTERDSNSDALTSSQEQINHLNETITLKDKTIGDLNDGLNELIKNLESEKNSHASDVNQLKTKVRNLEDTNKTLEEQVSASDNRIELANQYNDSEQQKLKDEISSLKTQLNVKSEQLKYKETQYNDLVTKSGIDENGASALMENYKSLESIAKSLREQLGSSQKDVDTLQKSEQEARNENSRLKAQVKQLNSSLQLLASSGADGQNVQAMLSGTVAIKPIRYSAPGKIIPVFGTGHGTTTFAMTLARKYSISSTVLYIDFDTVTPSADEWFNRPPYVTIQGVPFEAKETALEVLFKYGVKAIESGYGQQGVQDNAKLFKPIARVGRGGGLDYLSGVYNTIEQSKIASVDYTSLFNFLGSKYQYIVIDFGRLGANEAIDKLISAVTNISVKSVVVTSNNIFEIRNTRAKLNRKENRFNLNKVAWLINNCESTNVKQVIKDMIDPISFGIMFFDSSIFSSTTKKLLTEANNKMINDKFEQFVNYSIFK